MPAVGMLYFTRTRFQNKETKETAYLLDRILGLLPHAHMSDGMKAALLEKAVQTSYEKAGKEACPGECVSRETVMCHVRRLEIPAKSQEEPAVKRETRILYVEADEDVKAMLLYNSKGIETLGAEFVLDGSHIQKYIRRMARLAGGTEETREENRKKIQGWLEEGSRKKLEGWIVQIKTGMTEKDQKKLEESWKYIKNNWQGIRRRVKKEENINGSSTESHISHVLSSRLSPRPMGWCMEGMDKMAQLRVYWKNGGGMDRLVQYQNEKKIKEKTEEEICFSATEMITLEKSTEKQTGNT